MNNIEPHVKTYIDAMNIVSDIGEILSAHTEIPYEVGELLRELVVEIQTLAEEVKYWKLMAD